MKPVKVVSTCGKRQVSQVASAERGKLVTFVGIINAIGQSLPPVYIFPRIRNVNDYMIEAPIGSIALGNKSGWMTAELFPSVLRHIVSHTNCSRERPILLLIDNHESHCSLNAIQFARDNGICLLSFPPHTTHRLQPLDVGVYSSFKTKCAIAFNDWLISNPGKTISIRNIPELTKVAYLQSFTTSNIINSFKKPGLWPLNTLAFSEDDYMPSYVTDRPLVENEENGSEKMNTTTEKGGENLKENAIRIPPSKNENLSISVDNENEPSCSKAIKRKRLQLTPEHVSHLPKASAKKNLKSEPGK